LVFFSCRVLGKQLIPPTDEGFRHFQGSVPISASLKSSPDAPEHSSDVRGYVPLCDFQKILVNRILVTFHVFLIHQPWLQPEKQI
jgi:hypothetical protein